MSSISDNKPQFLPDDHFWEKLKSVDTPTICNAIEVAEGQRGFNNFTHQTMLCADVKLPAICGYARTARIKAVTPPEESKEVIQARRMDYYKYMADAAEHSVVVIEDVDYPHAIGAFWGEINTAVHSGFGLDGVLTNGVMRDLGDMQPGFQVIAGSVGPSHGFVHVLDFGQPVSFFGLKVQPNDIVHADRHGAVVIPEAVLPKLVQAIDTLLESEHLVLGPAREPGFNFEKFQAAWSAFEKART
jgi:regulator of RNase E activity RraA